LNDDDLELQYDKLGSELPSWSRTEESTMPRSPRPVIPGQPLHIIQRGNNRMPTFFCTEDFDYYLRVVGEATRRVGCSLHAYVLMSNHVHLLVTPHDAQGAARMMQAIGRRYVRYVNKRHGRTGTLWEGRFRSTLIDSESYFLACSRYVELNPVRAGIVCDPAAYRWSSFCCNALSEADALITPHPAYLALAARPAEGYRALFAEHLDTDIVEAIRQASRSGAVLAGAPLAIGEAELLPRRSKRQSHGGDRRSAAFRRTAAGSTTLTP
jgi:putative transposase